VLLDVLEDDPEWTDWSISQIRAQSKIHCVPQNRYTQATALNNVRRRLLKDSTKQ